MSGLFDPEGPKVYSIPAGANFLAELTRTLAQTTRLRGNPEALADALIYVPNRRSERALGFALHQAAGGQACLLPNIRALGDLETDEPPPSAELALAELPPVISPASRIGDLTQLVMRYFEHTGRHVPAIAALAAARELARLLDQAALSGDVDWGGLDSLVPNAQLARHWQQSLEFLEIITTQWPAHLQGTMQMDPYARRLEAAGAMANHWQTAPPESPVIIAGSTGATPASRVLMEAVLAMPNGLIVLPGLDTDLAATTLEQVSATPSHPQFTLARTLKSLGLKPDQVAPWPGLTEPGQQVARRRLIHQALAPAYSTADWTANLANISTHDDPADFVREAVQGLTIIDAKDDSEEALLAAVLMLQTIAQSGQTAALVTPDAGLARHVSAMLERWQIHVAPSAGWPLGQTDAGSLALLVADWLLDPSNPVALTAVLKHPFCKFQKDTVESLDKYFLRGPRAWQSWEALIARLRAPRDDQAHQAKIADTDKAAVLELIGQLTSILEQTAIDADQALSGLDWFRRIADLATAMATPPQPWAGEAGSALSTLFRDLTDLTAPLGEQAPALWNEILQGEMQNQTVSTGTIHPRLAIWGPLEARL
ncbi:MAG: hypothetical protein AAFR82_07285, partial [Pseudomonadota bacterium]